MRLELDGCLEPARDVIQHAVRIELGAEAPDADDASAVAVRVACAAEGIDAGVVLEVRTGGPRRYRYALDWHAQPLDARPRLIGLAVAEAVDASQIELTAVPEPGAPARNALVAAPVAARAAPDWTMALVADQRTFSPREGVDLLGVGVELARRLSPHLGLAADLLVEGATRLSASGAVAVRSVSSAPRLVVRIGGRRHAEVGFGARVGVVVMQGEALANSQLAGERRLRVWLGPAASVGVGADLTPSFTVSARFELGVVAAGATARDLGEPVARIDGAWTSFGLAATIAL